MGANKADPHHAVEIIYLHNQPVVVAFDVKHYPVVLQNGSAGIIPPDVIRSFPTSIFRFLVPGFKLLLAVGMLLTKIS
jgi:hypothetical protein